MNAKLFPTDSTPDTNGFFGPYGGQFVPEPLKKVLDELAEAYARYRQDPDFKKELNYYLTNYSGRPTPLFYCANLTKQMGGAAIHLKREDLNHLGAHKVNNTLGQILLAKRLGKKKVIAETGAGSHGVAAAATAALMGMSCTVYMGEEDMKRQEVNVFRMRMMGAEVRAAMSGNRGLKEAVDEAIDAWAKDAAGTFYLLGSAVGPHPYPLMVRDFQSVIGLETRQQFLDQHGCLPDACIACVGGGSNAIGMFHPFVKDTDVALIGAEPGGRGNAPGDHAATMSLVPPAWYTATGPMFCKTKMAKSRRYIPFPPGWITPAWDRNTHFCATAAARVMKVSVTRKPWTPFTPWPGRKGLYPRWSRPMPWPWP